MIQLIPLALAKLFGEPRQDSPPRFNVGSFADFVLSNGGEYPSDQLTDEEEKIGHEAVKLGHVRYQAGSWADPDWFFSLRA